MLGWLQPLPDETAPAGPDLEYDNDFLALTQASAGKPESQFGAAEPPDWRGAGEIAETLFDRTRDLRVAVTWLRASLHLLGYAALPAGLRLVIGLVENQWDTVHPLPDPDDGDPYSRVNALTLLRENDGLLGDVRDTVIVEDRAMGQLKGRTVEVALGLAPARSGDADIGRSQVEQMLATAIAKTPELRARCQEAVALVRQLVALLNDKLGIGTAPDLRPLYTLVNGVASLLPPEASAAEAGDDAAADAGEGGAEASRRRGARPRPGRHRDVARRGDPGDRHGLRIPRARRADQPGAAVPAPRAPAHQSQLPAVDEGPRARRAVGSRSRRRCGSRHGRTTGRLLTKSCGWKKTSNSPPRNVYRSQHGQQPEIHRA